MTFQEFLEEIQNLNLQIDFDEDPIVISEEWISGGKSGGSCWGTKAEARESDPEPTLTKLDAILEHFCPSISYLKYRNLESNLLYLDHRSQQEYYGNSYEYTSKNINLQKLFMYLEDNNLLRN